MKGLHHEGKPDVYDVINFVLEGFIMNTFKQTIWERPETHHLKGLECEDGDVRKQYLNEVAGRISAEDSGVYSLPFDVKGSPLEPLAKNHLPSAADFSHSPWADSSHLYDPIDHE